LLHAMFVCDRRCFLGSPGGLPPPLEDRSCSPAAALWGPAGAPQERQEIPMLCRPFRPCPGRTCWGQGLGCTVLVGWVAAARGWAWLVEARSLGQLKLSAVAATAPPAPRCTPCTPLAGLLHPARKGALPPCGPPPLLACRPLQQAAATQSTAATRATGSRSETRWAGGWTRAPGRRGMKLPRSCPPQVTAVAAPAEHRLREGH